MTTAAHYPIRAVARLTGLSVDTLRAWERRYGAVAPTRSERGRVYTERHVARLRRLAGLVERGHAIGSIARMSDAVLLRLASDNSTSAPVAPASDLSPVLAAAKAYDLAAFESYLARHAVVLPPRDFVLTVVIPVLREVGRLWQTGGVRPAQEHLVSAIMRSVLGGLLRALPRPDGAPRVVFATLPGERHELGLLSAAVLAASAGAHPVYLGPDLPAADLVQAVAKSGAQALVLAATTPGAVGSDEVRALSRLPRQVRVWVGGPRADAASRQIGTRATVVLSLDTLQNMVNQLAD